MVWWARRLALHLWVQRGVLLVQIRALLVQMGVQLVLMLRNLLQTIPPLLRMRLRCGSKGMESGAESACLWIFVLWLRQWLHALGVG